MARGYKRDSRGRFAGGYGAGALGGKGAYASRPNSGKGSRGSQARGGTTKLQQPKPQRTRKVLKGVGKKVGGLSTRQKTALVQIGVKGALLGGGYYAATRAMNKGEARLKGGKPLGGSTYRNAGKGRIEDIGATKTGGSLKDAVFRAANPMLHKDFSAPRASGNNGLSPEQMIRKMSQTPPGFRASPSTPPGFRASPTTSAGQRMAQTPASGSIFRRPPVNPGKKIRSTYSPSMRAARPGR